MITQQLMGDAVVKHFSNFPALTDLSLRHCSIDDKAVAALAKHSGLQNLDLSDNDNYSELGNHCPGFKSKHT